MDQRISLITLGVRDMDRATAFYDAMGWARAPEHICNRRGVGGGGAWEPNVVSPGRGGQQEGPGEETGLPHT